MPMGDDDGKGAQTQVAGEQTAQGDQAAQAQVTGDAGAVGGDADRARSDYEAALAERDARIKELEGEIAEAAKTAESAEKLRTEIDELRRQDEEQRVGFELQMAGFGLQAARALLADYDGDVGKLKAAEPWLFGAVAVAPAQEGTGAAERGRRYGRGRDHEALARHRRPPGREGVADYGQQHRIRKELHEHP